MSIFSIPDLSQRPKYSQHKQLKLRTSSELLQLFKQLEAPQFSDFQGPLQGALLNSRSALYNAINRLVIFNPVTGAWKGKQFFVVDASSGNERGYGLNMFGCNNRRLKFAFNTRLASSQFDDKAVLRMDYSPYPHLLGWVKAYDEIRQLDEHNFLLLAHYTAGPLVATPPIFIHLIRVEL